MVETAQAAAGGLPGRATAAPLDDVMLAMDVVDNLRHADQLVERELGTEERDRQLKERLRKLYAAQGIDVPEHILDEVSRHFTRTASSTGGKRPASAARWLCSGCGVDAG